MICTRASPGSVAARVSRWALGVLTLSLLLAGPTVEASDNHYQDYLVGERAVGLGGAFTALADDSSGTFYNPAGLAQSQHSSLSLSTAVYGFVFDGGRVDAVGFDDTQSTFVSYPTAAAWIQRLAKGGEDGVGRVQLGLSLITPRSRVTRFRVAVAADGEGLISATAAEDDTLWLGLSLAWKTWRHLALGVSLYTTLRNGSYQFYNFAWAGQDTADLAFLPSRADMTFRHYGLMALFGLLVPLNSQLKLALTLRTPQLHLGSSARFGVLAISNDQQSEGELAIVDIDQARFRDREPLKVTFGAAYTVARQWGLSADLTLFAPVGEYSLLTLSQDGQQVDAFPMRKKAIVQVNLGGEYYLWQVVALRAGFFTNLSNFARVDCPADQPACNDENPFTDEIDRVGLTTSIGYEIERATLTLALSYNAGSKSTRLDNDLAVKLRRSFLFLSLGGSFRF